MSHATSYFTSHSSRKSAGNATAAGGQKYTPPKTPPGKSASPSSPSSGKYGSNSGGSSGGGSGGGSVGVSGGSSVDLNNAFDAVAKALAPKAAKLINYKGATGGVSTRSYHRPLNIYDTQSAFDSATIHWNEMFDLNVNSIGDVNVIHDEGLQHKIKEMAHEIMFEVFCEKY